MNPKKKGQTPMQELIDRHKQLNTDRKTLGSIGREAFEKALRKATKPKQRGSK